MMKTRKLAHAAILAAGFLAAPLFVAACPANVAKPFTAGPLDAQGMFSQWVVDGNGVGLQICTDSVTADGNPPPCFYDPVVPGNALSEEQGRGGEAFWFLADSSFTTPGPAPITGVLVMGLESAYLANEPTAGFQTQFQRLRTRLNVSAVGIYTVETPWGKKSYTVTTLLRAGGGQSRMEISEPIDISFNPSGSAAGLVTPFLVTKNLPADSPYIGDGVTLTEVTGSPCGDNFIRITATGLDGVTPIAINNVAPTNVYTNNLFTVQGKLAPKAAVPLSISAAYFSRSGGVGRVTVMAEGSTSASQQATVAVDVGGVPTFLVKDGNRFYATVSTDTVPTSVTLTAEDRGRPSLPNTQTALLRDLVTIHSAEARCSGSGQARTCQLSVEASSSDDGSGPGGTPELKVAHANQALVNGKFVATTAAVPAAVTVRSTSGGAAVKPVIVINQ